MCYYTVRIVRLRASHASSFKINYSESFITSDSAIKRYYRRRTASRFPTIDPDSGFRSFIARIANNHISIDARANSDYVSFNANQSGRPELNYDANLLKLRERFTADSSRWIIKFKLVLRSRKIYCKYILFERSSQIASQKNRRENNIDPVTGTVVLSDIYLKTTSRYKCRPLFLPTNKRKQQQGRRRARKEKTYFDFVFGLIISIFDDSGLAQEERKIKIRCERESKITERGTFRGLR